MKTEDLPNILVLPNALAEIEKKPNGAQEFAKFQKQGQGLKGLIICAVRRDGTLEGYLDEQYPWDITEVSDTQAQYPKIYYSLTALKKKIRQLENEYAYRFVLGLWNHPDAHHTRMPELVDLQNRFPGSPSQ